MIRYKLGDLPTIMQIFNNIVNMKCNVVASYTILKIMRKLKEDYEIYHDTLQNLKLKYAKVDNTGNLIGDENGKLLFDNDENRIKFFEEAQQLMNTESEIHCSKIPLSQLANGDLKLSPSDLIVIENFIEDDMQL